MKLRSTKGFSLVELIIVIAIMGIIAVVAVPNLTGIQTRSTLKADITTASQIGKAVRVALADEVTGLTTKLNTGSKLSDLSADISTYIGTSYKHKGAGSTADFYVKLENNYIKVGIGTSLSNAFNGTYGPSASGNSTSGVAYEEGKN